MPIKTSLWAITLAFLLVGCQDRTVQDRTANEGQQNQGAEAQEKADTTTESPSEAFLAMTEEQAKLLLRRSPLVATSLGVTPDYLGMKFADKLGDFSLQAIQENKQTSDDMLALLQKYDRHTLKGTAATTYDVLKHSLNLSSAFKPYVHGAFGVTGIFTPFTVTQMTGPHISLPRSLQSQHPLKSEQDAKDYLSRMEGFKQAFEDLAKVVRLDIEKGIIPPTFAIEGAINVIDGLTSSPPEEHPLVRNLTNKLSKVEGLSKDSQSALTSRASRLVDSHVYPGYATLKQALMEIMPKTSDTPGIWALKDGDRRYQLALENFGAAGKTPKQIHELGLAEVERIQGEMDQILKTQGYGEGGVIERYLALSKEERFLYPNTDQGREQLLSDLNTQMKEIEVLLPNILITLPKAGVEVRRIAVHEQDNAPGGYYTGASLDGKRPGIYWINLKNTADWPKFTLPTLTYHEASPGHHLQVTIAQEVKDMPMLRNMMWFSSYGEGWALYAEVLAKELGLYKNDPFGDLGRLQAELFRSARLVVDTGLHYKKWTRQQAIDYMHQATGESLAAVTREIERYAILPGQACAYKLGQLKILELRAKAKEVLGQDFDLRRFNDELLIHGAVPLTVLEANVKAWLQSAK